MVLLLYLYVSLSKEVIFFHNVMKGNKQVPFSVITSRERARERRGEEGKREEIGVLHKDRKLNCHSSFHLYLFIVTEPYALSLFLCIFIRSTFSLYAVPLTSGAKNGQFLFRKQISEHQIFAFSIGNFFAILHAKG